MANYKLAWMGLGIAGVLGIRKIMHRMQERNYTYRRKVVFITGASRGLGLVLARQLAAQHARLVICARNAEELAKAKTYLQEKYAAEVLAIPCDVGNQNEVQAAMDKTVSHYGRIDVVINNAGIIVVSPIENNTVEDFDANMRVYFYGPLYTMQAAVPFMKKQFEGRIINISSIGGRISVPHLLPYSAAKFALTGLSEGMHAALKKDGIHVTTIYPGLMRTGSPRNVEVKGQQEKEYAWFKVSDSLPGLSINADKAAAQILRACRRGDASLTITLPAKVVAAIHGLMPGLVQKGSALANRLLPSPTNSSQSVRGYQTEFEKKGSWLTRLTDRAAKKNLEVVTHSGNETPTS